MDAGEEKQELGSLSNKDTLERSESFSGQRIERGILGC